LEQGVYYASAFYAQQAAEKSLKAVYITQFKKMSVKHNIVSLSEEFGAPPEIRKACRKLNPHYVQARYPDAANAIPAEACDDEMAQELLEESRKVFGWSEKQVQK